MNNDSQKVETPGGPLKARLLVVVFLVILTGGFLRFYGLRRFPPGLWFDEAQNALDAITVFETMHPRAFFTNSTGREGLLIDLTGLAYYVFGIEPYIVRYLVALAGLACIPLIFPVARRFIGAPGAALVMFLLATSKWHIIFSRIGFRAMLMLPLILFAIWMTFKWVETRRLRFAIAAGFGSGLGFYTYLPARIFWLLPLCILPFRWKRTPRNPREHPIMFLAVYLLAMGLVIAPLASYFIRHPGDFSGRLKSASYLLNGDFSFRELAGNTGKTFWMLAGHGDENPRHGIPGDTAISRFTVPFLLAGIMATFFLSNRRNYVLLAWFFITALPSILGNPAPHALRTLAMTIPVTLLSALGYIQVILLFNRNKTRAWAGTLAGILLALGVTDDLHRYFYRYPRWGDLTDWFSVRETRMIQELNLPRGSCLALTPQLFFHPTVRALSYAKYVPVLFEGDRISRAWWMDDRAWCALFVPARRDLFWCRFVLNPSRNWVEWWYKNGYWKKDEIIPAIYNAYGTSNPPSGDDSGLLATFSELCPRGILTYPGNLYARGIPVSCSLIAPTENAGDALVISPERFLSETGTLQRAGGKPVMVMNASAKPREGFLAYGPYIRIPVGRYCVTYHLGALDSLAPGGEIDVDVAANLGRKILGRRAVSGNLMNGREPVSIEVPFTVDFPAKLEFRVWCKGQGELMFHGVTVRTCSAPADISK